MAHLHTSSARKKKDDYNVGQVVAAKKQEPVDRSWWQVNAVWPRTPNHQLGGSVQPSGCPLRLENGDALVKKKENGDEQPI